MTLPDLLDETLTSVCDMSLSNMETVSKGKYQFCVHVQQKEKFPKGKKLCLFSMFT